MLTALNRAGVTSNLRTFLANQDLYGWLTTHRSKIVAGARGSVAIARTLRDVAECDVLLVHREALPFNNLLVEKFAHRRGKPIIWDVDDSVWVSVGPVRSIVRGSERKYRWLARNANEVWAGNRHVADWALAAGARDVILVPTTVPVPKVIDSSVRENNLLVWIGTPSTGRYIQSLLQEIHDRIQGWRVLIVGATIAAPPGIEVAQQPWSLAAEAAALRRAAVGLYPLDVKHASVSGKSALKSILFMAHGIPVIATSTASNAAVMTNSVHGYLVDSQDEWIEALSKLSDPALRSTMGAAGHEHAARTYDAASWGIRLAERVEAMLQYRLGGLDGRG